MIHRKRAAALILVLAAACGGDTSGAEAFCDAARDLAGITPGDAERTLDALERMRTEAPEEIRDAINVIADTTQEGFETGDRTVIERQEFLDASDDLDSYLEDNCEAPEDQ
jgi:hypothetical protein